MLKKFFLCILFAGSAFAFLEACHRCNAAVMMSGGSGGIVAGDTATRSIGLDINTLQTTPAYRGVGSGQVTGPA